MTAERAQSDTPKPCGQPTRAGTPCKKLIPANADACARHTADAEQKRADTKATFLAEYSGTFGDVTAAAARAGTSREMAYAWRETDPAFRAEWDRLKVKHCVEHALEQPRFR